MAEYEVLVRTVKPCPGPAHDRESYFEVETDDPIEYVRENAPYPILDSVESLSGELVVVTGDGRGNFVRYSFTE